jgi:hypothetical protein
MASTNNPVKNEQSWMPYLGVVLVEVIPMCIWICGKN